MPLSHLSTHIKSPHGNYTKNETYEIKLYQSVLSKLYCDNKQPWKILVSYNSRGLFLTQCIFNVSQLRLHSMNLYVRAQTDRAAPSWSISGER